jgi:TolB protein
MKRSVLVVVGWIGLFLSAQPAAAQVRGKIFGPGLRNYPIAISPLAAKQGAGELGTRFADTVARDLELSGQFRTIDRAAYIEKEEPYTADTINFPNWSVIGALALIKGWYTVTGDTLTVEVRLFDVYQRRQIVGKRYTGKTAELRRMAHRFADEVMLQLTGERGPFDSRIAFISTRGGRFKELFVMSLDGTDIKQLTSNRTINLSPSWRDAGALLWTSFMKGSPGLYAMDLSSPVGRPIWWKRGFNVGAGSYSPDGSMIALAVENEGNTDIALLRPDGQLIRRFTDSWGIDASPTWSPDGTRIAFNSDRSGSPQIYIQDVGGGEARRLTTSGNENTDPAWSPDGKRIAYIGRAGGTLNIFTIDVEGGDVRQLTQGGGKNEEPSWSPDSRYIVFSSTRTGRYKLFVADAATGSSQVQLTAGDGDDTSPAWSRWLQ